MSNFTNTKIKDTYQRVLQIDNGEIQDGLGLPVDARIQSLESDLGFTGDLDGTATLAIGLTSGDKTIQGNLDVIGKITAIEIYAQYESASIIYSSGSTKFGDTFDDTHQFTGSVSITGSSFLYNGYNIITSNDTGSIVVNSASYAQTASYIQLSGVDGFTNYSSSVSSRVSSLENFSSSLDATFATDAQLNAATASLSSSIASLSSSYLNTSSSFSSGINANSSSISALSSSFISFSASYNTGSFTGSFTGNLQGTSSWATNAISSSHALTASYVNPLIQNVIITGSLFVTQSHISTVDYIDFNTTPSLPAFLTGRLHWTDDTKTLQLDTDVNNFSVEVGHQNVVRVRNTTGYNLAIGKIVYINGESGNRPTVTTASWDGDPTSATTLGFVAQQINDNQTGYVVTNGMLRGINTSTYSPGTQLYLSSSGDFTSTIPLSPKHEVRLGKIVTQAVNGTIYVDIMNGYEIGELHDVLVVSSSAGDLLVKSGSLWINTKQLTGSYGLTGSLSATSFTGSLFGTSSWAVNAQTASFAPNYVLTSVTSSMLQPYVLTSQTSSMFVASASYVNISNVDGFVNYSSSVSTRIVNLENFSSSLDATFATDAQLNAATASLSASISSLSSSYLNTSASFSSGIDANAGDITALSSSFVSFSSSYNTGSYTGSFTGDGGGLYNIPASGIVGLNLSQISSGSVSASISPNNGLQINTNTTVAGDLIIQGTASITYLNVTYESASVIYSSGSNQFGDAADDTQTLYGTVLIQTGSLTVTGSVTSTNGFTGSLLGTSSWATNAISSSHALTSISASYALSASHAISASYALTASFAVTSSYALNTVSASFATQALSSSFAQTASFAPNYVLTSVTSSMLAPYVLTSQTSSMFVASASYVSISNVDGFTVYSSSVSSRISSLENFSSSLDATFATDAQLNSYTSSANNRLNALEIESGSIRSDFNAFTSSYTTDSSSFASRISINAINITNLTSATSSYVLNSQTGSFILTSQTSSMSVASASVATSASYALTSISASYAMRADSAAAIDVFVFGSDVESYLLMSNVAGTTGVAIGGDADLRYNSSTNKLTVGSVSATSLTGSLFGTASWANNATTASYVLNAISSSFASTASFVQNAQTASYVLNAISSSFSSTASYVNTLNQNVLITGSLTVGTTSAGASENTLTLGPRDNGSEGGQLMLQAPGGTYTSASMWDNYANKTRLLRGTNAGSDAEVVSFNMHSKQVQFPAYNALNAFSGTPVAALGVDNGGNIITIQTGSGAGGGGGSTFSPGTNVDNRIITATGASPELNGEANLTFDGTSLTVTGEVTASGAIRSTANNQMYFRGGDDAEFWDINIANTVGIYGQQNADRAGLKLGSSGPTLFGSASRFGINTITPTQATLEVNGNVYATSFTGSLTGSLVGSLTGTASWASNAVTASFASSGGSPAFPYTGSAIISGSLTVTGSTNIQGAIGISQALIERAEITISASGLHTVYSAPTSSYRGIFADYTLISTSPAGNARAGNIMSVLSGSQVRYTETRTSDIGNTAAAAVQVSLSGGNLNLELNVATVATTWNLVSLVRTI